MSAVLEGMKSLAAPGMTKNFAATIAKMNCSEN